jgi:fumarate reductase subunit D
MWDHFFGVHKNTNIPLRVRLRYFWVQVEGMYSWATAPILILIVGRLPLAMVSGTDKATAFVQNAPVTLENLMTIGMVGLILNAVMYTFILPERPKHMSVFNWLVMV